LIRWTGKSEIPSKNQGIIQACQLLAGNGVVADLSEGEQSLLIRNSLIVSRDEILRLKRVGTVPPPPSIIDIEQSTLAAGRAHFLVDCPASGEA